MPSTCSPRDSSSARKPAVIAASTTSLTVPPSVDLIVLISSREVSAQPHRRCGPIPPPMVPVWRAGEGLARRDEAVAVVTQRLEEPVGVHQRRSERHHHVGEVTDESLNGVDRSTSAFVGSGSGAHGSTGASSAQGSGSRSTFIISAPDTPSTMAWCTLVITAQRSPSRPSTNQDSHRGRRRSRVWAMTRLMSAHSCSAPPGFGTACGAGGSAS